MICHFGWLLQSPHTSAKLECPRFSDVLSIMRGRASIPRWNVDAVVVDAVVQVDVVAVVVVEVVGRGLVGIIFHMYSSDKQLGQEGQPASYWDTRVELYMTSTVHCTTIAGTRIFANWNLTSSGEAAVHHGLLGPSCTACYITGAEFWIGRTVCQLPDEEGRTVYDTQASVQRLGPPECRGSVPLHCWIQSANNRIARRCSRCASEGTPTRDNTSFIFAAIHNISRGDIRLLYIQYFIL